MSLRQPLSAFPRLLSRHIPRPSTSTIAALEGPIHRRHSHGSRSIPGSHRKSSTFTATNLALLLILPSTAYLLGSLYPPSTLTLLFPRPAPPPLRPDTPEGIAYTEALEKEIQGLDIVREMRERVASGSTAEVGEWYETRPAQFPTHHHSLTSSVLRGPSLLAIPPIAFVKADESQAVLILHLGRSLCGHDGIVHGGLVATVFDEALGRNALLNIPSNIGVTASLNLQYKKPTRADQFIIIRTRLDSISGRKISVSGLMEDLQGQTLATASALFVEPSYAKYLENSGVAKALGKRPEILDTGGHLRFEGREGGGGSRVVGLGRRKG